MKFEHSTNTTKESSSIKSWLVYQEEEIVQTVCCNFIETKKRKRYRKPKPQRTKTILTFRDRRNDFHRLLQTKQIKRFFLVTIKEGEKTN